MPAVPGPGFRGSPSWKASLMERAGSGHARQRTSPVLRRAMPIYLALLLAILSLMGVLLLVRLKHVLLIVFVSMLFAAAMTGPVEWLATHLHLPRALSALGIYVLAFVVITAIGWLVLPPLFN